MKSTCSILCLSFVCLSACNPDQQGATGCREMKESGFLLTTDLPPESLEGTAKPVVLPPQTPMPSRRATETTAAPEDA